MGANAGDAARRGKGGGRGPAGGGGGIGRGALLEPALVAALRLADGTLDQVAERLAALTNGALSPDGSEIVGALQSLERQGIAVSVRTQEGDAPVSRTWRLTAEGRVRTLAIAERLHERARLTERIAAVLESRGDVR